MICLVDWGIYSAAAISRCRYRIGNMRKYLNREMLPWVSRQQRIEGNENLNKAANKGVCHPSMGRTGPVTSSKAKESAKSWKIKHINNLALYVHQAPRRALDKQTRVCWFDSTLHRTNVVKTILPVLGMKLNTYPTIDDYCCFR